MTKTAAKLAPIFPLEWASLMPFEVSQIARGFAVLATLATVSPSEGTILALIDSRRSGLTMRVVGPSIQDDREQTKKGSKDVRQQQH